MAKFTQEGGPKRPAQGSVPKGPSALLRFFSGLKEKLSFLRWIDPFTYVDLWVMPRVKKVTQSESVEFIVNVLFAFFFAWLIYTILGFAFQTATPLVIVYSASMESTLFRGDVMALARPGPSDNLGAVVFLDRDINNIPVADFASPNYDGRNLKSITFFDASGQKEVPLRMDGSIVVYSAYPSGLPIIHRAIFEIIAKDGNFVLTKGDNFSTNPTFDEDCGKIIAGSPFSEKPCISFYPVPVQQLQGKAFFEIPKVGCVKLWLVDDLSSLIYTGGLPRDFRSIC